MKAQLISVLVGLVIKLFTPELLRAFLDMFLDWIEQYVKGSASTVDDKLVLPICDMIRLAYGVPDNDNPPIEEPD